MSALVPPTEIEGIVGAQRDRTTHLGRAISAEEVVYVLHSQECLDSGADLRECPFSLALDLGINPRRWKHFLDQTVGLVIVGSKLMPFSFRIDGEASS